MSTWQEWVVALLLLVCAARIVVGLRSFLRKAGGKDNPCSHCATGCDLKRLRDDTPPKCTPQTKNKQKNCCG